MNDKPREYYDLQELLKREGYTEVAEEDNYIWSVLDYLSYMDNNYTIFEWLEDTKKNYPGDLEGYSKYGYIANKYETVCKMVEEINDFTDSVRTPRIGMKVGVSQSSEGGYYVMPINRTDRAKFKVAVEYVLTCLWQN